MRSCGTPLAASPSILTHQRVSVILDPAVDMYTSHDVGLGLKSVQEVRLLYQRVEEPSFSLHKRRWCVEFSDPAMIKHYHSIAVKNCVDPMRDCYDRAVLEHTASQGRL